ncbi:MAG: response regulator [Bacteroidota bacterium]
MAYRILIVEDDPLIAAELAAHLRAAGFGVTASVGTGEEALRSAAADSPAAAIMDIRLAGELDGIATAHLLNERHALPVVFLTANTDRAYFERARATFPLAFVGKPYDPVELVRNLEVLLRRWGRLAEGASPLFFRDRGDLVRLDPGLVHYIAAAGNYCDVFTADQRMTVGFNLKNFLARLPTGDFCRIHRSYAVNLRHLQRVAEKEVRVGQYTVPLAQGYRTGLLTKLERI